MLAPPAYGATGDAMAAATELGLTPITSIACSRPTRPISDPAPAAEGPQAGRRRLNPRDETIIKDEIETRYLTLLKPEKSALMKRLSSRERRALAAALKMIPKSGRRVCSRGAALSQTIAGPTEFSSLAQADNRSVDILRKTPGRPKRPSAAHLPAFPAPAPPNRSS
jgi:hypothetical protein